MSKFPSPYRSRAQVRGTFAYYAKANPDGLFRIVRGDKHLHAGDLVTLHPKSNSGPTHYCFRKVHHSPGWEYGWTNISNIQPVRGYQKTREQRAEYLTRNLSPRGCSILLALHQGRVLKDWKTRPVSVGMGKLLTRNSLPSNPERVTLELTTAGFEAAIYLKRLNDAER